MAVITGFIRDAAGQPVKLTRAYLVGQAGDTQGDDIVVPTPVEIEVGDDGLLAFDAATGRAQLHLEVGETRLDLPLVVRDGYTLGDALREGRELNAIDGHTLMGAAQEIRDRLNRLESWVGERTQAVETAAEQLAADTRTQVEDAARRASKELDAAASGHMDALAVLSEQVAQLRDDAQQAAMQVDAGVAETTRAANTLTAQLESAQGLVDTMEAYVEVVNTTADGALHKLTAAQDSAAEIGGRVDALAGRVEVLETAVFDIKDDE
ncbi:hypothetical protein C1Y63_10625 [Corynebacterium sp. 13CS0277]|uniref:hypothetical protein n=1 Tax=Corynebacterium sp. 13CS0277 TaxID=2071994 RepID=UPI000D023CB1|nr:hypothetical protein [Corynebacterium sp. 13CS0277]PRQ10640.1 hypothetical protein C1Y63_10625 [Corynebacterium sp. 13CS0277]